MPTRDFKGFKAKHTVQSTDVIRPFTLENAQAVSREHYEQSQWDAGKFPEGLQGKVVLKTERDPNTNHVTGWHWVSAEQFDKTYNNKNRLLGKLRKNIYYQEWIKKGEI